MMKQILILLLFIPLIGVSQDNNGCPEKSDKNYNCGKINEDILMNIKIIDFNFKTKIKVEVKTNFKRKKDIEKAKKVTALINKVLNDKDFWKALEYYEKYRFSKWSEKLEDPWRNIEGQEITNCFLNGNPENSNRPILKSEVLSIKLYGCSFKLPFEKAVAKENDGNIYNKKWFFRKSSIKNIGSNWMHELSHSKGIRHCFYCNSDRDYSIPYVINRLFIEVAEKYE